MKGDFDEAKTQHSQRPNTVLPKIKSDKDKNLFTSDLEETATQAIHRPRSSRIKEETKNKMNKHPAKISKKIDNDKFSYEEKNILDRKSVV